jgi:hypothetical protein
MRFISLQDPVDNWMVYDTAAQAPAELGGNILIGLSRDEANLLVGKANAQWGAQSPADAVCRFAPRLERGPARQRA